MVGHGRRGVAPNMFLRTEVSMPQFLSLEVVGIKPRCAIGDNDSFAVSNGRGGTVRIRRVCRFTVLDIDAFLPEKLAVGAIEAHQCPAMRQNFCEGALSAGAFDGLRDE